MITPRSSRLALAAAAAFVLALAAAYSGRRAIAERVLLGALGARGVAPVELRVVELDAGGLALAEVVAPGISIAALEATWSLGGLRERRLDRLSVTGLRMQELPALSSGAADGSSGTPLLPARELELRDALLSFTTQNGVGSCALEGHLSAPADGSIAGELELALEHPLARANGAVAISGTLAALAGELSLLVRDGRTPARVAPATLSGRVSGAASALAFDLALDGANGALHAEARGTADLPAGVARAELRVAPIVFAPKGLHPAELLPALEPVLAELGIAKVVGSVEARGTFALDHGAPELALDVALRDVGLETKLARLSGVSGAIELRAPPLRTPKGQLLSIARVDAGLALANGLTDFQLLPGGAIEIASTTWSFVGGELRAQHLRLDASAERTPVTLEAHGLELAQLLALAPLQGLEGTGRIDGELPIVRDGDQLRVAGGALRARPEGGVIRYRASDSVRALAKSRPNDLGIAVAAFSDFHYDALDARIDGDLRGELAIALHVRGSSPAFQSGQPIELNLNLESRLADLVREGIAVYRVPQVVEERLRAFSKKGKP